MSFSRWRDGLARKPGAGWLSLAEALASITHCRGPIALSIARAEPRTFKVAQLMGLNYAPRMRFGKGTAGP